MFKKEKRKGKSGKDDEKEKAKRSTKQIEAETDKRKANLESKKVTEPEPPTEEDEEEKRRKEEERKRREDEEKKRKREEEKRKAEEKAEERRKKKEAAERKKAEEERRKAEEEDDEGEIQELESVPFDANSPEFKDMYKLYPFGNHPEVFNAYNKLQNFARELNTQIDTPEIVVLGFQGHGKSSVIEGFLGQQVCSVGYGATRRPLYLNMINNVKYEKPKVTIKKEQLLKGGDFDHDLTVSLGDLPEEIAKRNKISKLSDEPIFVQYEYKYCTNLTLIDTPGLVKGEVEGSLNQDLVTIAEGLVSLPQRHILCVEEAKDWDKLEMPDIVKAWDPEFARTTFVYTKFHFEVQKHTNSRQVNRFLQGAVPDARSFFTTLLAPKVRQKFSGVEKFREKIYQSVMRDLRALEQLQYDRRFEAKIGVLKLRDHLLNMAWKKYQDDIPMILKRLRGNKAEMGRRLLSIQEQLAALGSVKLRSIASHYVVQFLQTIDRLVAGTSEGNPAVNGQSLEEEKAGFGDGDWVDSHNRVIKFHPEEWGIPYWEHKLYGGQQFERLLSEFKAVAENQKLPEVTMDDIATAAGINKLNNIPNYAWAASDLAGQKAQEELVGLIEQTVSRAVYILKRLVDMVEKIMESRRQHRWDAEVGTVDVNNIELYPFFTHHIKDLYFKFVDSTAKAMQAKCMDEFYGTRTIFWEYTEYSGDRNLPRDRNDEEETRKVVEDLSKELFERLKQRIVKNVLLKFYNFLLVPIQTELWSEIQTKVTTLSDEQLDQIFEVNATRSKLLEDEKSLQATISSLQEQEVAFLEAATHFSHPVYFSEQRA